MTELYHYGVKGMQWSDEALSKRLAKAKYTAKKYRDPQNHIVGTLQSGGRNTPSTKRQTKKQLGVNAVSKVLSKSNKTSNKTEAQKNKAKDVFRDKLKQMAYDTKKRREMIKADSNKRIKNVNDVFSKNRDEASKDFVSKINTAHDRFTSKVINRNFFINEVNKTLKSHDSNMANIRASARKHISSINRQKVEDIKAESESYKKQAKKIRDQRKAMRAAKK